MPKPVAKPNDAFRITCGKGFQMTFANGYTISVQFGYTNYCDNRDLDAVAETVAQLSDKVGSSSCRNAEFLAWDSANRDVFVADGWLTPDQVFAKIAEIVALPRKG
jgi:hypothetical protein